MLILTLGILSPILPGIRLGKNILGGVDVKITGFEKSFQTLRTNFSEGVTLNTELFVLRMISDIGALGKSSGCSPLLT